MISEHKTYQETPLLCAVFWLPIATDADIICVLITQLLSCLCCIFFWTSHSQHDCQKLLLFCYHILSNSVTKSKRKQLLGNNSFALALFYKSWIFFCMHVSLLRSNLSLLVFLVKTDAWLYKWCIICWKIYTHIYVVLECKGLFVCFCRISGAMLSGSNTMMLRKNWLCRF